MTSEPDAIMICKGLEAEHPRQKEEQVRRPRGMSFHYEDQDQWGLNQVTERESSMEEAGRGREEPVHAGLMDPDKELGYYSKDNGKHIQSNRSPVICACKIYSKHHHFSLAH